MSGCPGKTCGLEVMIFHYLKKTTYVDLHTIKECRSYSLIMCDVFVFPLHNEQNIFSFRNYFDYRQW